MARAVATAVKRVLVVEDDPVVGDVVRRYLEHEGMQVVLCADGPAALAAAGTCPPDLVVLDLGLPGMDGLEVFRRLRRTSDPALPVVMLTARGDEQDRLLGLGAGADDYVVKPFSPRELVLRVRSVLRRTALVPPGGTTGPAAAEDARVDDVLVDRELRVDVLARIVTADTTRLRLTAREHDLLVFLLRHPGQAFSRQELLRRVWGWTHGDPSTVTVHVRRLREKLETDPARPSRLVTVFGVGYRYDRGGPDLDRPDVRRG